MDHMYFFHTAFTSMSHGKKMNGCSSMFSKTAAAEFLFVLIACLHMHIVHRQIHFDLQLKYRGRIYCRRQSPNGGIPNIGT